jgi:hypothetical protein
MTRTKDDLRHHLGHVLLYLGNPKAQNECEDAGSQWKACLQVRSGSRKRGKTMLRKSGTGSRQTLPWDYFPLARDPPAIGRQVGVSIAFS